VFLSRRRKPKKIQINTMQFFAVLAVCLAVANARPDVSHLGYNYPKPQTSYSSENYVAQPPLTGYTGDASNAQFLTVPGQKNYIHHRYTRRWFRWW